MESNINMLENKTLLIVDDNEVIHIYYDAILAPHSVNLLHAHSGREAIALYQENDAIDLILMDMRMPGLNGQETLVEILKIDPDAKVIAQTAFTFEDDREKMLEMGFHSYLSKPIDEEILLKTLREA